MLPMHILHLANLAVLYPDPPKVIRASANLLKPLQRGFKTHCPALHPKSEIFSLPLHVWA